MMFLLLRLLSVILAAEHMYEVICSHLGLILNEFQIRIFCKHSKKIRTRIQNFKIHWNFKFHNFVKRGHSLMTSINKWDF